MTATKGTSRLRVAACLIVAMTSSLILAQEDLSESDRSWWERTHAQYEQVWSGRGTLVYTAKHPGRQQYIEDMIADTHWVYDPTKGDYYPEIGPDTLRLAFDKRANRIRLDGTRSLYFFPDGPRGERRTRETRSQVWNGEELRELTKGPSPGRLWGVLSSTKNRLPLEHTLESPLVSRPMPLESLLPEIILRDSLRIEPVPDADEGGDAALRRFRVMSHGRWQTLDIDRDQGFTILRREYPATPGYPYRTVIRVFNKEYERGVWYPARWTSRVYEKDRDRILSVNTLVALDFSVNIPIPEHHFDLEFPEGVDIMDQREDRGEERSE